MPRLLKFTANVIILSFVCSGFFFSTAAETQPAKLAISQVQTTNGPGLASNDFVKIYNPNDFAVDLQDYRLVKRTKTGQSDTSLKAWSSSTPLAAHSYHLWANSQDGFAEQLGADSATTATLANDNGLALRFGPVDSGQIIDSLGWGQYTGEFLEGSAALANPVAGQTLFRVDNLDTNNNLQDFVLLGEPLNADENNQSDGAANNSDNTTEQNNPDAGGETNNEPYLPSGQQTPVDSQTENTPTITLTVPEPEVYISEILPNPQGLDWPSDCLACGEFIELYNASEETINLQDWRLQVDTRPAFAISHYLPLLPDQHLIFYRYQSGLLLQNNSGEVRLYQPNSSKAKQTVKYNQAPEGSSYNLLPDLRTWQWSKLISPGKNNNINYQPLVEFYAPEEASVDEPVWFDASDCYDQDQDALSYSWDFGNGQHSLEKNPQYLFDQPGQYTIKLTVNDGLNQVAKSQKLKIINPSNSSSQSLASTEQNQAASVNNAAKPEGISSSTTSSDDHKLTARGVVVVEPGIFSSQFFYILPMQDEKSLQNSAVQIYSYNKSFPALQQGDYIEAKGQPSDITTDNRLKISSAADIAILDHDYIVIERPIKCDQVNHNLRGQLISLTGQITDKNGRDLTLSDDSGQAIISLTENSGLKPADFTKKDSYQIIGLARQIGEQIKIMPRSTKDILPGQDLETTTEQLVTQEEILGEKITDDAANPALKTITLPPHDQKQTILEYLLILATGIIIFLLLVIIKLTKNKK